MILCPNCGWELLSPTFLAETVTESTCNPLAIHSSYCDDGHASCHNCKKQMLEPDYVCECGAYICFCCFEKGACPDCGEALE